MGGLALLPHVGFGLVGARPVFLDLRQDRYIALDPASERSFLEAAGGAPIADGPRERLLATGLFRAAANPAPIAPVIVPAAQASLLDRPRTPPRLSLVLRACVITARANRRLAREPLLSLLQTRAGTGSPRQQADADTHTLIEASAAFLAVRPLVPIAPRCLPDSLALRDWLNRAGHRPTLVFGVRMDPFGAHCWLQQDALVLNDAVDRIAAFTPVLASP